jgi:hypothetical protein
MARWIYQRPIEYCDPTELIVANRLALLSDAWVIRWGFYYDSDREGDFLILGPTGGVSVLEVKGGDLRKLSIEFLKTLVSDATSKLVGNLRYRTVLPEGPDVELYTIKPERTAEKLEEIITRWVNDGFCRVDEILILSPHGTKAKTSLAGCSQIGEWPLASCVIRKPGELSLLSINKAKGLDSLAVIMIDTQSFDKLSNPQQQMDYFMGASRSRQLLAILHRE